VYEATLGGRIDHAGTRVIFFLCSLKIMRDDSIFRAVVTQLLDGGNDLGNLINLTSGIDEITKDYPPQPIDGRNFKVVLTGMFLFKNTENMISAQLEKLTAKLIPQFPIPETDFIEETTLRITIPTTNLKNNVRQQNDKNLLLQACDEKMDDVWKFYFTHYPVVDVVRAKYGEYRPLLVDQDNYDIGISDLFS